MIGISICWPDRGDFDAKLKKEKKRLHFSLQFLRCVASFVIAAELQHFFFHFGLLFEIYIRTCLRLLPKVTVRELA
jgi:hypothetical protein